MTTTLIVDDDNLEDPRDAIREILMLQVELVDVELDPGAC